MFIFLKLNKKFENIISKNIKILKLLIKFYNKKI